MLKSEKYQRKKNYTDCVLQAIVRTRILKLTSCQAENSEFIGRAVASHVDHQLGIAVEFVDGVSWQKRERLLDTGAVHAGWICGLPYVRNSHHARPGIELPTCVRDGSLAVCAPASLLFSMLWFDATAQ